MTSPADGQNDMDAALAGFLTYWHRLRGMAALPSRGSFQPGDIPRLLPYLTVAEPLGERFRVRLVGTEVHNRIKRPVRIGMMLDELETGPYLAFLTEVYRTVVATRQPVLSRARYDSVYGDVSIHRVTVPFGDAAGAVSQMMSALAFSHTKEQHAAIEAQGPSTAAFSVRVLTGEARTI